MNPVRMSRQSIGRHVRGRREDGEQTDRHGERAARTGEWFHRRAVVIVALIAVLIAASGEAGTLSGVVTTTARALPQVRVTVDPAVCGAEMPDESILVDVAGRLANAVVTLVGVTAADETAAPVIMNERCRFTPRVQIVRPGALIRTSSTDAVLHTTTVQGANGRPLFSVALPVPGITMSKPVGTTGVARVTCNTHPWMRAWLVVTNEMSAVTDESGAFTMANVPPGTYELRVWHEVLKPASHKVTVTDGRPTTLAIELR